MKKIKHISLIFIFTIYLSNESFCQKDNLSGFLGFSLGGPIPTNSINNSSGTPKTGALIGLSYTYHLNSKISLNAEIQYTNKRVEYSTKFRKDTLIPQEINNTIYYLNSFYNAYVNGKMNLHYIENQYTLSYNFYNRNQLITGIYLSVLTGGYDKGDVQVVIGEGGFLGDYFEKFDNFENINNIDYGFILGLKSYLYKNIFNGFKISRSIKSLYSNDIFSTRGLEQNNLYHTYAYFFIGIDF